MITLNRPFVSSSRVSSVSAVPARSHRGRSLGRRGSATVVRSSSSETVAVRRMVTVPNDDTGDALEAEVSVDPCSRVFQVSIKKPLGLVLAERGGRMVVESVAANGHAAAAGVVAGDFLLATGARAQKGGGASAPGQPVLLATAGESFNTVAAAIRSNTCAGCAVHLVFERPQQP